MMIPLNLKRSPFPTRKYTFFIEFTITNCNSSDVVDCVKQINLFHYTKTSSALLYDVCVISVDFNELRGPFIYVDVSIYDPNNLISNSMLDKTVANSGNI